VRLRPALRQLLIADCLIRLCEGLPDVFLVIWAIEIVRVSPAQFGLLTSVLMVTAIASYVPAAALAGRTEKKPFVLLTYVFFTLYPLAILSSRSFGQLVAAYAIGGLREIGEPARKALIVDLADPSARGKTVGLYYAIRGFAVAGAAAIGGGLWTIRPSLTFWTAAALGLAGTLWAALFLPSTPRLEEERT
jgi:MFS family permease